MTGHSKYSDFESTERHRMKNRERMRETRLEEQEAKRKTYPPSALIRQVKAVLARRKARA
jgi:hypothetical protein